MLLAKEQGGTTVAGHTWENDGDAVDVPYDLAMELLAIKGGGFYVPAPDGEPSKAKTPPARAAAPAAKAAAAK